MSLALSDRTNFIYISCLWEILEKFTEWRYIFHILYQIKVTKEIYLELLRKIIWWDERKFFLITIWRFERLGFSYFSKSTKMKMIYRVVHNCENSRKYILHVTVIELECHVHSYFLQLHIFSSSEKFQF